MNEIEKELEEVILSLANVFSKEALLEYHDNWKKSFDFYNTNFSKISSVSSTMFKFDYMKKIFIEENLLNKNNDLIIFFSEINRVSNAVRKMVNIKSCETDKTNFILRQYINHIKGQSIDSFIPYGQEGHHYWHPEFGTEEDWFNYIKSYLIMLNNVDKTPEFLEIYNCMLSKKEKVIEQIQEDDDAVNKIFKREKEKIQKYFELEPWELSSYFGRFLYENLDKVKKDSFENIVEEFKIYYQKNH